MNKITHFLIYLVAGICGSLLADILFPNLYIEARKVIAHQCAHYDEHTGAFTWNTTEGK